ncbi:MAG: serine/threonine-protein kinase [Gemmatimonadaceae bacterium]
MPDSPAASDLLASLQAAVGAQYDIERALGAGGMGTVFLARDRTLERPVAIKVISPELAASKPFRQRFLQEARTVAKLRHPNIVAVYAAGEAGDPASGTSLLYFVMEYVPGESLRDLIDRERGCDTARSIAILRDLASALGYAHTNGIVHRDIKPENVLLDGNTGRPLLTDFGVAQALSSGDGGGERMTGVGFIIGSPSYMSPEQASGEREIDGRSDIYSLGLVGYEMFSGQPTFTGPSAVSVIAKQITERPTPLAERVKDVPPEVAAAIDRALEKDPAMRWSSGSEMARALETGVVTAQYTAGTRAPAPPRNRTRIALLAAVAALVVAIPVGWWRQRSSPPSATRAARWPPTRRTTPRHHATRHTGCPTRAGPCTPAPSPRAPASTSSSARRRRPTRRTHASSSCGRRPTRSSSRRSAPRARRWQSCATPRRRR